MIACMFYSTHVRANRHSNRRGEKPSRRKEALMTFALTLALVLVLSSAYLFHQWYTGDLLDPGP